jgi:hypothetical protein
VGVVRAANARWILDDGPFGNLASIVDATRVAQWPSGRLLVAGETAAAAALSTTRQALLSAVSRVTGEPVFGTIDVALEGEAGALLYGHFRRHGPQSSANLAEHQALAWILAGDEDTVFVTQDKTAAAIALSEVGGARVAWPYELSEWLRDCGWVTPTSFQALCGRTQKASPSVPLPWRLGATGSP